MPSAALAQPTRETFYFLGETVETIRSSYVDDIPQQRVLIAGLQQVEREVPLGTADRQAVRDAKRQIATAADDNAGLAAFAEILSRVMSTQHQTGKDSPTVRAVLRGMTAGLDAHSEYLPPAAAVPAAAGAGPGAAAAGPVGPMGGIGLELSLLDDAVTVVRPLTGSPAALGGVRPGDILRSLDGTDLQGATLASVVARLRGPVGSPVQMTVQRAGQNGLVTLNLTRAVILLRGSQRAMIGRIGFLRIESFGSSTETELRDAIQYAVAQGGPLEGFVLDLRANSGGLLDAAAAVAGDLLAADLPVVTLQGRTADNNRPVLASGDVLHGVPLVVVVNGRTAAGAEIVAGALQDHRRAIVVGTPTFGGGTVQTVIQLGQGGNGGLIRLTTARIRLPFGRSFQRTGIIPDIVMRPGKLSLATALDARREADLPGSLPGDSAAINATRPELDGIRTVIAEAPPLGDPDLDPARPQDDFEVRQAVQVLRLLHGLRPGDR